MNFDQRQHRLAYRGSLGSRAQSFVVKALTAAGAVVVLVAAIAMSLVLFAFVLSVLLVAGGFVWWKLRQLRKVAESRFQQRDVIEGVVVRDKTSRE